MRDALKSALATLRRRRGPERELLVKLLVQPATVFYVGDESSSPVGLRVDNRTPYCMDVEVYAHRREGPYDE
jgi:hypothetical protein